MITVNALGEACPMPVVKAKKAIDALTAPETVQVLVDNDAAVQNLIRLAGQYGFAVRAEKQGEAQFTVTIDATGAKKDMADKAVVCAPLKQGEKNIVVAISKDHMGEGEEALGKTLLKAFIFALTQQDALPKTILFYNSGAFVTSTEGPSIEDLKTLEAQGVDIVDIGGQSTRPGSVRIKIMPPIQTAGMSKAEQKQLPDAVRQSILAVLK